MMHSTAPTNGSPSATKTVRAPTALGVSMLLLLLSAIHTPSTGDGLVDPRDGPYNHFTSGAYKSGANGPWQYTQTPYLAYVASIAAGDDIDVCSVLSLGSGPSTATSDAGRARRRNSGSAAAAAKRATNASDDSDSDAETASFSSATVAIAAASAADTTTDEHDLSSFSSTSGSATPQQPSISVLPDSNNVSTVPTPVTPAAARAPAAIAVSIDEMPVELLAGALSFLNAKDLAACRAAANVLDEVAEAECATTSAFGYVNGAPKRTFVVVDPSAPCRAAEVAKQFGSSWCCARCNAHNAHMAEFCRGCKASNGTTRRVFFGQLRKEQTAEVLHFLIAYLRPDVRVIHIESHTNPTNGRGKGCAWVYVASDADAAQLLTLNKTLFFDFDVINNREGVWISGAESMEELAGFAAKRAYLPFRPDVMPRGAVVVELPANSNSNINSSTAAAERLPKMSRNRRRPAAKFAPVPTPDTFFNYHNRAANTVTAANTFGTPVDPTVAASEHYRTIATATNRIVTATHYEADASLAYSVLPADTNNNAVDATVPQTCQCEACLAATTTTTHTPYTYGVYGGSYDAQYYYPSYSYNTGCTCADCNAWGYHYQQ